VVDGRTPPFQKPCNLVHLALGYTLQDLLCRLHISTQNGGLVLDDGEGEGVVEDLHVLIGKVNTVVGGDVAEHVEWSAAVSW
jgi:hypothetical protein